jgi:hypothetical protein
MARALIVGCGCRGRELGVRLLASGWQVRGTTRRPEATTAIAEVGIEAVIADPDAVGTVHDQLDGVTVVYWLLGSAAGAAAEAEGLHGPRLERLLEKLVDTPVRGFVYEGAGTLRRDLLERGAGLVGEASERWRIPAEVVEAEPGDPDRWAGEMADAADRLVGGRE